VKQATIGTVFTGKSASSHIHCSEMVNFLIKDQSGFRPVNQKLWTTATATKFTFPKASHIRVIVAAKVKNSASQRGNNSENITGN